MVIILIRKAIKLTIPNGSVIINRRVKPLDRGSVSMTGKDLDLEERKRKKKEERRKKKERRKRNKV